jgi:hypothetical protein
MKKQYDNKDEKYTEFFVQVDDAQEFCYVTSIFEYYRLFDELSLFGNEFKGKDMYFFNPYFIQSTAGYSIPLFKWNTFEGIGNEYQAKMDEEIHNKLLLVFAKLAFRLVFKPFVIAIKDKKVHILITHKEQEKVAREVFSQSEGYTLKATMSSQTQDSKKFDIYN